MQILPLVTPRAQAAADAKQQNAALTSRQSAMFASLMQSVRDTTQASATQAGADRTSASSAAASTSTSTDPLSASDTPSRQDLMDLPLTREDLAALHDDLVDQGFSDDELAAMEQKVDSPEGLTWGEMMHEVEKKVSKTKSNEKKEVSNEDTVQLLGLFGKLGFTADESQSMVDSLGKGESEGVWSKISDKVASLGDDSSVSLSSSEMATLGRTMNLSEAAQKRLTALFDQSNAESGLSGQGLRTAFGLVKNEVLSQLGQEAQSMQAFRQAASVVLDKAWQRQQTKISSDLHQDDVARKAAQVVAMGGEKKAKPQDVPTASQPGIDVLADVPDAGTSPLTTDAAKDGQDSGQARQAQQGGRATGQSAQAAASELHGKAGAVATEQAVATGNQAATTGVGTQTASSGDTAQQAQASPKQTAATPQFAAGNSNGNAAGNAGGFAAGQQGGGAGGSFEQNGQEGGWGEFWSKVRVDKSGGQATTGTGGNTAQTMAAMDAVNGSRQASQAKPFDAALAARAARQLETGILRNVGQDAKQLTLNLSPDELGKLSVTLTVKDKEVKAIIKADNADTAAMLHDQAAHIKKTLEDQGFKVTKLEVQTGAAQDNQTAWQSPEQHNQAREQREAMERMRSSQRLARSGGSIALDADASGFVPQAATSAASGLDLFA
ncbi:flagellar hook-length control protein FliK [Desulfovibrio sp. JY]|nr:flagellar hook-length control protein FliK [Desulfovibrio sp. JY]